MRVLLLLPLLLLHLSGSALGGITFTSPPSLVRDQAASGAPTNSEACVGYSSTALQNFTAVRGPWLKVTKAAFCDGGNGVAAYEGAVVDMADIWATCDGFGAGSFSGLTFQARVKKVYDLGLLRRSLTGTGTGTPPAPHSRERR